jgi:hypothetical protein
MAADYSVTARLDPVAQFGVHSIDAACSEFSAIQTTRSSSAPGVWPALETESALAP